jgi:acylphosphatase
VNAPGDLERRRGVFSGNVQGVGFRFTTLRVAGRHPVTGYVKNLRTGDVELVAEGRPDDLRRFLADVEQAMFGHIAEARQEAAAPTGEFDEFEIRH